MNNLQDVYTKYQSYTTDQEQRIKTVKKDSAKISLHSQSLSSMESKHCIGPCQDDVCFKMGLHIKPYRKVKTNYVSLPTPSMLYRIV